MEFDPITVNALLDVIIKTKDTSGWQLLHNAAMEQLRQMIESEVTKLKEAEEEKPWQQTRDEQIERRV